jgi:hypothetical protein
MPFAVSSRSQPRHMGFVKTRLCFASTGAQKKLLQKIQKFFNPIVFQKNPMVFQKIKYIQNSKFCFKTLKSNGISKFFKSRKSNGFSKFLNSNF